jgi:hypothetical protein
MTITEAPPVEPTAEADERQNERQPVVIDLRLLEPC